MPIIFERILGVICAIATFGFASAGAQGARPISFNAPALAPGPGLVAFGDFNGDGKLDLLQAFSSRENKSTVTVRLGNILRTAAKIGRRPCLFHSACRF